MRAVGAVLYRAEGTKTGHVVDFTNSDPLLIAVFLAFLRLLDLILKWSEDYINARAGT